mgnify:CR=1 FL=1
MAVVNPRIAPFINVTFYITSKWWNVRVNPVTGETEIHRGLDISTGNNDPVYSMLKGVVHSSGYSSSRGNWIIIWDNDSTSSTYGYATLYMHLRDAPMVSQGSPVLVGQQVGVEGTTGVSTGIHLHVEMQDLNRWGGEWHSSYTQSDYLDPTEFMNIPNVEGTECFYDGTPVPPPTPVVTIKKNKFKWVLYARKFRNRY